MPEVSKPHSRDDSRERLEWTRSELNKPGRNTFWPDDIEFLLGTIDGLEEQLEAVQERLRWYESLDWEGAVEEIEELRSKLGDSIPASRRDS